MKVFADTSGLFAAIVSNDVMHAPAKATLTALLKTGAGLHARTMRFTGRHRGIYRA